MTEEQIERSVEWKTDEADRALMAGRWTQAEYDEYMRKLNAWTERQYGVQPDPRVAKLISAVAVWLEKYGDHFFDN